MWKGQIFSTFSFDFKVTNLPHLNYNIYSFIMSKPKNIPNENLMKTGGRVVKQFKFEDKKNIYTSN